MVKRIRDGEDAVINADTDTTVFTGEVLQLFRTGIQEPIGQSAPYTIDATKNPAVITFLPTNQWILKVEGDLLTICENLAGIAPPPQQFVSLPNTGVTLTQYTRIKK